jgi:hypothetical protein
VPATIRKGRKSLGYVVISRLNNVSQASIAFGEEFHVNTYGQ